MNKFKQLKEAIKNTSPDRLAKIEYQSHFMQILGVSAVCGILIFKGFWWIIFAFIFSLGVSFSQCVSAYQKYHAIKDIIGDTYDVKKDKSFTRKRDYIIKQVYGNKMKWLCIFNSIVFTFLLIPLNTWYFKILFSLFIIIFYVIQYFYVVFPIAKAYYDGCKK